METIGVKRIMDRLLVNPNMKGLKASTVAGYIKDMISINHISPLMAPMFVYLKPLDGMVTLPTNCSDHSVTGVFYCDSRLPQQYFNKSRLIGSNGSTVSKAKEDQIPFLSGPPIGVYDVKYGVLHTSYDKPLKVEYSAIPVDAYGYPTLPYDGSLMQATLNYVKAQHYTILAELNQISQHILQKAEREYSWYIGQYTTKNDILTYDEAVSVAHTWQRLVDTRDMDISTDGFREYLNL